jgi:hypothetical protein
MMKKILTLSVATVFICALVLSVSASLPNVNLGSEIKVGTEEFQSDIDNIIKKAGLTMTRAQFRAIYDALNLVDTGLTFNNIAAHTTAIVILGEKVEDFAVYERYVRDIAGSSAAFEYERFLRDYNAWRLAPEITAASRQGTFLMYWFEIRDLLVETEFSGGVFDNLQGATLSMLIEIPEKMRGDYDYYVIGESYSHIRGGYVFAAANEGNALAVSNNFVTAVLNGLGSFALVAIPRAEAPEPEPPLAPEPLTEPTTADAMNILRHIAGIQTLTNEQRISYGLSWTITTNDAMNILRKVAGLTSAG